MLLKVYKFNAIALFIIGLGHIAADFKSGFPGVDLFHNFGRGNNFLYSFQHMGRKIRQKIRSSQERTRAVLGFLVDEKASNYIYLVLVRIEKVFQLDKFKPIKIDVEN